MVINGLDSVRAPPPPPQVTVNNMSSDVGEFKSGNQTVDNRLNVSIMAARGCEIHTCMPKNYLDK